MNREYHRWYSPSLGKDAELLVFGHAGPRVVVFPAWRGRFYQYEDRGMVEVVRDRLEGGALQLYCVDGFDAESLYNRELSPRERILRHLAYERYVLHEVVPLSESSNPNSLLTAHGCSLGAFHAVNIAFRHPCRFTGVLALSGRYELTRCMGRYMDLFDGYYDQDVYFNTPSHFVPNLTDAELLRLLRRLNITLVVGSGDAFMENNRALSTALWDKGIWHAFRVWDSGEHDFPCWRQMLRAYPLPGAQ